MWFKKLVFDNYKTYYGHQELNLFIPEQARKDEHKNIILIGGLNGAGKTTILKAIVYVLFGKRGISAEEHSRLFSNVINDRFFDEGGRECYVTLILRTDKGEDWELKVQWCFDHNKRLVNENREIVIRRNGVTHGKVAKIDNIEVFNRFIDKIIPYHAAPFFLFDGEEIKGIILRQNSSEMKDSIQKLTGMEAHKQLLTDLQSLKEQLEKKLSQVVDPNKLSNLQKQISEIEADVEAHEAKKSELVAHISRIEKLLNETKKVRNEKLTQNSSSKNILIRQQSRLSAELEFAKSELDKLFEERSMYIILDEKIAQLKNRLKREHDVRTAKTIQESALIPFRNFISAITTNEISPPLSTAQVTQIRDIGEQVWRKMNNIAPVDGDTKEIHDISNSDYQYITGISTTGRDGVVQLVNTKERLSKQIAEIESQLRNAPDEVDISEENEKIDSLTKKLGELELRLKTVQHKLSKLKDAKSQLTNNITRLSDQGEDFNNLKVQLGYVNNLIKAVTQYVSRMTIIKARFIKDEFSNTLERLMRKKGEFGKIEFDIDTYTVRLYNDRNQEISIRDRSAGEMQIISSALIWALTKASDLSLPMVIDTPLGRLDSIHRDHLVKHYYNELSEQVVILSTDTEITQDYIDLMEQYSYRQYMLDYDQFKKYTIIRDGYFEFVKG